MEKEKVVDLNEGIPQKDLGDLNEKNNAMVSSSNSHNLMKDNPGDDASTKLYQFDCAEVVSKEIINLAISLAITENYKQQISKLIPNFCYNYVYEIFKNFLLQEFISYDKCKEEEDEEGVDNNNNVTNSNDLFYNNNNTDMNTWKEIKEPSKPFSERDASTLIKPMKATEEDENKYDSNRNNALLEMSQTDNSVKEEKHHNKKVSKFNVRNKFELISKPKEEGDQSLRTLKKGLNPSLLNTSNNKHIKTKEDDGNTTIRERNDGKDRNKVIELETHSLPPQFNWKFTEELLNEFETLRKNRIIETSKKQEEERLRKEQENKELMLAMAARNAKEIDTQRITFDSNGNIIPLKFPRIEALGNEFWWSRQIVKELSVFPTEIPKEKPSTSPQNKDKKGNQINKSIGIVDDKKNKRRDRYSLKSVNLFKEERNISYNVDINELFKNKNSKNSKPNIPIIPAGSNMNLINPEIGVIISDEKQKKEGSMEFSLKFNKFSMEEFSRIALESMNNNTTKNLMSSANSNFNNESNPYIGYAEKFHSSNNPLIQNAHASKNSDEIRSEIFKNRLMTSENPLMPNARILFRSQNLERINLSNQLQTNLKTAIELVEETGFNQSMMNVDIQKRNTEIPMNTDIIKENQLRDGTHFKQPAPLDLNMIDSFNSNIIKSKDWGSSNISSFQSVFHRRPVKSNHIMELGLKIVSTKLPRERKLVSAQRINSIR